jgi:integrase
MSKPRKLPSGKWRIRFLDHEGERQSATFVTEAAARAALRRAQVERDDIRSGKERPRASQRLKDAAKEWLKSRPAKRQAANSSHLDHHILPFLGEHRLAQITPAELERFIRHLEAKPRARKGERNEARACLSAATIQNVLITLRKLMNDCGHLIRIKHKVPTSGYAWICEAADVGRFLAECGDGWLRVACELAVYAGLRKREVAGLRRDAVDFDRGLIVVDRSYDGPTKSKQRRYVPISPELAATLKKWMLSHRGPLVVTVDGEMMSEDYDLARPVRRACKRAGVGSVNFHQLRHTAASHLAQRVPLPVVGAILGHANPMTTARYAHLDTEGLARSERVHLSFQPPKGEVLPMRPIGAGHVVATAGSSGEGTERKPQDLRRAAGQD